MGPEKSVLSCLMQEQHECIPEARALGVTEASFHFPQHALLFTELLRIHDSGREIELVSLTQTLHDWGKLDRVGGPATLTEINSYAFHTRCFAAHVALIRDKELQRDMIRIFRDGIEAIYDEPGTTDGHLAQVTTLLSGLSAGRSGTAGSLRELAYRLRFDPAVAPPAEEVCLMLGDIPVAARGNITVLQGKSKVGKSAAISAILGAVLATGAPRSGDCLGFRWLNGADPGGGPGVILHLDTEQSPGDWHALVTRALQRAGLDHTRPPEWLVSLPLVTFARSQRLTILRDALEHERKQGRRIDLVIIDGIADLCVSPNDEAEGLEVVSRVLALAHDHHVAIGTAIHENPGTDAAKTRGHLGSELNRKAFANLRIDKDGNTGVSVIYGTDMRKREIPKHHGFCFAWDDKAGMHVSKGKSSTMKARAREEEAAGKARKEWAEIFEVANRTNEACPDLSIKMAREIHQQINRTRGMMAEDAMRKRMQRAEILGVLRKTGHGIYAMTPNRTTGQKPDK